MSKNVNQPTRYIITKQRGIHMNQRLATTSTLLAVLQERGVEYEQSGPKPISDFLTEADIKTTQQTLCAMFRAGQVDMSAEAKVKYQDDKELKKYVSGLVSNWIRKAPEFNCDKAYVPKNPGSRAGQGDSQIKEMKKLLAATTDAETKKVIEQHIAARQEEIKPVETGVDFDKIPEALRAKLGL
jgi:hypothetical protein